MTSDAGNKVPLASVGNVKRSLCFRLTIEIGDDDESFDWVIRMWPDLDIKVNRALIQRGQSQRIMRTKAVVVAITSQLFVASDSDKRRMEKAWADCATLCWIVRHEYGFA